MINRSKQKEPNIQRNMHSAGLFRFKNEPSTSPVSIKMSQIPSTNERSLCKPRDYAANMAFATPLRAWTCCIVVVFSGRVYPFQMEDDGNEEIGDRCVPRRSSSGPRLRSAQGA